MGGGGGEEQKRGRGDGGTGCWGSQLRVSFWRCQFQEGLGRGGKKTGGSHLQGIHFGLTHSKGLCLLGLGTAKKGGMKNWRNLERHLRSGDIKNGPFKDKSKTGGGGGIKKKTAV